MSKKEEKEKQAAKYVAPSLVEYGSVRQFTRGSPTGPGKESGTGNKTHKKSCIGPLSEIEEHRFLLADTGAQEAFRKAIFEGVRPGDVVLDLGTGSGLHAFFACQAGAKKVYAVDSSTVIELAKAAAEENGFSGRIEFLLGDSGEVDLPEKVDVIVTNTGFMNTLEDLPAAGQRFLKKGGRLLPSQASLSFVPVEASAFYDEKVRFWTPRHFGFRFNAFQSYAANHPHVTHILPENFLSAPVTLPPIRFTREVPLSFRWSADFLVERAGVLNGLAGWYSFQLSPSVELSTRPPLRLSPDLWFHPFLPLSEPVRLEKGQALHLELGFFREVTAYAPIWTWEIVIDGKRRLAQTSFDTVPLSPQLLSKLAE